MRGERMKSNSLEVHVVSGEVGGDGGGGGDMEGVKADARKRRMPVQGSALGEKVPLQCRSKKTPALPPTAAQYGSSVIKAHHHRRSPSLHAENSVSPECSSRSGARALRQSVSFSGGSASRPNPARHNSISRRVADAAAFCLDQNVQVFIRARPVNEAEIALQASRCVRQENAQTISWLGQPETRFTFDHVAGEFVTQEEVFRMAGLPMVDNCMAGYNSCMFAYGQTGSGKTHTMLGDVADFENRGMTPRVFEYLFARIRKEEEAQKQRKLKYKCRCSFLEIYNEQISDLLEPASTNLQMREDAKKGVFVEGLLEVEVRNAKDVLHLLSLGAANRKVAATNMNRESSRSHSVFTCVIESQWECDSMVNFRFGRLNLVDLAGSERHKDTGADEERLREAASINKSLSTLGLVMMVLVDIADGKHRHVPYRDSKLTFLLQDSLGGNSKTTIIANISPSSCASSETLSTLKFAQRAKFIQNNAVINEELASGDVKGLQEKVHQLKDELARVRRQSVSRILPVSERKDASVSTNDAKGGLSPTEGSFLQLGRAVPSPTVLNHKMKAVEALLVGVLRREKPLVKTSAAEIEHLSLLVKQREDESHFPKTTLPQELTRVQEIHSEECDAEERPSVQVCEKRRTMVVEDISYLRKKLLDLLDKNISMDAAAARPQHEALLAELAAERQMAEQFRNEVGSHERGLSECRTKLQISLESNKRIASEMDALRLELESFKEECRKHKRDLATLQLKKALEVNHLESKQAQHQKVMLELKTQLQKSEEKAEQEKFKRNQIEVRLQEALQESANLQTELQWTRDSLEGAEAVMGNFQNLVLYNNCSKHVGTSNTEHPCSVKEKRKIKHQEAILQLQMELASIDSPDGTSAGFKREESPGAIDMETEGEECPKVTEEKVSTDQLQDCDKASISAPDSLKERPLHTQMLASSNDNSELQEVSGTMMARCPDTCIIMETVLQPCLRLEVIKKNLEACNVQLRGVGQESEGAEKEVLETQVRNSIGVLENALSELSTTQTQVQEALDKIEGESLVKKQALVEAEQRYVLAEAARLKYEEEHLDLHYQIKMREEEIAKLKEQGASDLSNWVNLEKPDLQVALGEPEDHLVEKNQVITNLQQNMLNNSENEIVILGASKTTEDATQLIGQTGRSGEFNWINVVAGNKLITSKNAVPQSICEGYPSAGKTNLKLARTQVLPTGSEGKVKLPSEMVAKVRNMKSEAGSGNENTGPSKEGQDCRILKAIQVFSLAKENADLQNQLLETEAGSTALKSTIANLQRELQERSEEVAALTSQLHVSDRHIFKLECQSVELRDAMQRQAVAFGALYEQLQNQESLQEEKAELETYQKKAERYRAKTRELKAQVETLQLELEKLQPLREEIALISGELHTSRASSAMAIQETERLVQDLEEEVKRKQCAIEALEEHLLKCEQSKLYCQEELQRCERKAEVNRTQAREKQVEVEILGKTVEELETTVYALESQVGLLKTEGERQCSVREHTERELQGLKQQNVNLHAALSLKNSARGNEMRREYNAERKLEESEAETQLLRKKHQTGTQGNISPSQPKDVQKAKRINWPKGSLGSAFRWFKTNHGQVHSELDVERKAYERRIQELENALGKRQLQTIALEEKLADAERVTRDVLRVLRGVKVDMANAADEEVGRTLTHLNNFIEERESWLEIISRKQAELIAARLAMEKLREHNQALVAENKKLENENRMQVKRIGQLEQEVKTLSGQQTKHHVKLKNENNALRIQNNDLSAKLRRVEHANARISDELAKYRIAQGRPPLVNIEEEQRLRTKLKQAQERSSEAAKKLARFSASVIKATGMDFDYNNARNAPSMALEALEQMKTRSETIQLELDDSKLKIQIVEERQRLRDLRKSTHSPPRGIDSHREKAR